MTSPPDLSTMCPMIKPMPPPKTVATVTPIGFQAVSGPCTAVASTAPAVAAPVMVPIIAARFVSLGRIILSTLARSTQRTVYGNTHSMPVSETLLTVQGVVRRSVVNITRVPGGNCSTRDQFDLGRIILSTLARSTQRTVYGNTHSMPVSETLLTVQ